VLADLTLLILIVICLYTDLRERRIYNLVVLPVAALGVLVNSLQHGLAGLESSIAGLGLGVALFILPFAMGGLGAGDVKLLGAIGALKGASFVLYAAMGTALSGGVIALGFLLYQRRLMKTVKRLCLAILFLFDRSGKGCLQSLELLEKEPYNNLFPYGAAIFLGVLLAFFYVHRLLV
jgi:prepilin peptidase CpaA